MMSDTVFLWFLNRCIGRVSENNPPSLGQEQRVCAALGLLFCCLLRAKENHSETGGRGERVSWEMDRNNQEEQKGN